MLNIADLIQTDQRARRHQHPVGRQADAVAEDVRHAAAVAAVRTVRAPARSGRPRQAETGVLLRRSAPAVHRRARRAGGKDRAGGAADPLQGRRRLSSSPRTRPTCRTRCCRSSATACSTRCAPFPRATRRRSRPRPKPCATIPRSTKPTVITELGVGEALVSFLDEKGRPGVVERAFIVPPQGQIGPITAAQRQQLMRTSLVAGAYDKPVDRESAYESLKARAEQTAQAAAAEAEVKQQATDDDAACSERRRLGRRTGRYSGGKRPQGRRTGGVHQIGCAGDRQSGWAVDYSRRVGELVWGETVNGCVQFVGRGYCARCLKPKW